MLNDLKFALRMLIKSPGFTLVAVLSLALGIGINSTLFSAMDAAFMRPIPFGDPQSIVRFEARPVSFPEYRALAEGMPSLASLAAVRGGGAMLRDAEGTKMLPSSLVSSNYFETLGVRPGLGRFFSASEGEAGAGDVVISDALWQSRFGGDPEIIGKRITLNNAPAAVIGVAPRGFRGENRFPLCDVWLSMQSSGYAGNAQSREISLIGRLREGASPERAQAEARPKFAAFDPELAPDERERPVYVVSQARFESEHMGRIPILAMPVIWLVLIVACANVSGLLLARYEERRRELALRAAIGGGRLRLLRQLLAESLLLALLGAGAGLLLTVWCVGLIPLAIPAALVSFAPDLHIDRRLLIETISVSMAATLFFGLVPAWRASRTDPGPLLKGAAGISSGPRRWSLRNLLVVGQIAVTLTFLIVAGLFLRGFQRGAQSDLGFSARKLLLVSVMPSLDGLNRAQTIEFCDRLPEELRTFAQIKCAVFAAHAPLALSGAGMQAKVSIPGDPSAAGGVSIFCNSVGPGFFATLGQPLLRGREFNAADSAVAERVAVVNQAMADKYWPDGNPLDKTFALPAQGGQGAATCRIVGVVGDAINAGLDELHQPYLYFPLSQQMRGELTLIAAVSGDPADAVPALREAIRRADSRVSPLEFDDMPRRMRTMLYPQWLGSVLGATLGGLTVLLAMSGLFALLAYAVSRRTHEIGVRLALGARPEDVVRGVLRQALVLCAWGLALGAPIAAGAGFLMRSLLFGIGPADPIAWLASVAGLMIVAALAAWLPARRAALVDPMTALRAE